MGKRARPLSADALCTKARLFHDAQQASRLFDESAQILTRKCSTQRAKMVVLNFTLAPEAAAKIHDLLICLGKFSDTVAIEARQDRVGSIARSSTI